MTRAADESPASSVASRRCSVETNSSCMRSDTACASVRTRRASLESWSCCAAPDTFGSFASSSRSALATDAGCAPMRLSTAGTTPSGCSTRTRSRCATSSWGWPSASASCCAETMASLARWVNRSVRIGLAQLLPGIRLRVGCQDRLELLAGRIVELWEDDASGEHEIALRRRAALRQAAILDTDLLAVLGVRPDAKLDAPIRRRDRHLRAEQRLRQGERQIGMQVGTPSIEAGIRLHADRDDEVAAVHRAAQLDL